MGKYMNFQKNKAWRSKKYIATVKGQPCLNCGSTDTEDHHDDRDFYNSGTGIKAPDSQTIPLCRNCHTLVHNGELTIDKDQAKVFMVNNLTKFIKNNIK